MLGVGALGRPRGMVWGGRREEGSGNNIIKKKKRKKKKESYTTEATWHAEGTVRRNYPEGYVYNLASKEIKIRKHI